MINNQDWLEAYKELCILINANIPEIKHIDLWYNQLSYEKEEYPFPESSLFIEFNTNSIETMGIKAQAMNMQIRFIYAFDTLSDTFAGSENQAVALAFGNTIRKLHKLLQGTSGTHFSSLNRIALNKIDAVEGAVVYAQTYSCIIVDYAATDESITTDLTNPPPIPPSLVSVPITPAIVEGTAPNIEDNPPLFNIEV